MEWHGCRDCSFRHPWIYEERACSNIGMTREQVLRVGERMVVVDGKLVGGGMKRGLGRRRGSV
jgi:hypothetical protein